MDLLEIIYLELVIFLPVVFVLIILDLYKLYKLLVSFEEVVEYLEYAKRIISFYKTIPDLIAKKFWSLVEWIFTSDKKSE